MFSFDAQKDRVNRQKHGVSLSRASEIDLLAIVPDDRLDYGEARFRGFGLLDEEPHCLVFTLRGGQVRAISLRRARMKGFDVMSQKPTDEEIIIDDENPEWTESDFARAKPPHEVLPPEVLALFKNTKRRGPQKAPTKAAVSLRLSPDVLEHFKASGPGWQTRIDETLKKAIARKIA